ncbi:MAG: UbiA family prenyltransferase [Planctomycetes bacterium]|nr:UbiA family prenyltransferase [Planctomycetota bacterium]
MSAQFLNKNRFAGLAELLELRHSLLALPFAFSAVFMASGGLPGPRVALLVVVAMVAARTAGMSFNRVLDAEFDAKNPRTAGRAVASGHVRPATVWLLGFASLALLVASAWMLNPLAFALSPLCCLLLFGYSLCKRFTAASHFVLGLVEAFAPMGGWIAVRAEATSAVPWLLGAATLFWIAGLDIVYATQDREFDRRSGLHSLPAAIGIRASLILSRLLHLLTVLLLFGAGLVHGSGIAYHLGVLVAAAVFLGQHRLVSPEEGRSFHPDFFRLNSLVALAVMAGALADPWLTGMQIP